MRFAILTTRQYASSRVRAEALHRMFSRIGVSSRVFYDFWGTLTRLGSGYRPRPRLALDVLQDMRALAVLAAYDVLVVCGYIPGAFLRYHYGIEALRRLLPGRPIVLYLVSYLANSPDWEDRIRHCMGYGISRYDWHLVVSPVGKRALAPDQPCCAIGINFQDPELFPAEKKDFLALLDFEQKGFERFRELQVQALEDLGIEYIALRGKCTFSEVYEVYRRTSIHFLAFLESFGLPICETQICGNYVFTPDRHWPQAHRKLEDFVRDRSVVLSDNFVVYDGLEDLKRKILLARERHDSQTIYNNFVQNYPCFYYGNLQELRRFVHRAERGGLWGRQ